MTVKSSQSLFRHGKSKQLVILLHAFGRSPVALDAVKYIVEKNLPDADVFTPDLHVNMFSTQKPTEIVQNLLMNIDELYQSNKGYEKIVFVGHSLGSLIARKTYVCACGEHPNAPFEVEIKIRTPREWAGKVDRIILLAGLNRGWQISHHLSLWQAVKWRVGSILGDAFSICSANPPLIFSIRRGAPFITQLRIHWLYMRSDYSKKGIGNALTVQLLGSIDDMVSPEDNIDLVAGQDFIYLDVPYSGHKSVIEMRDPSPLPALIGDSIHMGMDKTIGGARAVIFKNALLKSKEELNEMSVLPADHNLEGIDSDVTDVVFVIHGIRDKGFWTHKIARRVLAMANTQNNKKVKFATETSSYGYFQMFSFILPTKRKEKVEWLMDQYAEALAKYPNAEMSFVGHSNGTYLLTRALKDYPVCRFKHVVLAGSVVRTDYDWIGMLKTGQVKKVLNYVATSDWVVAWFPGLLQIFDLQDLGSAGQNGFKQNHRDVKQIEYIKGTHDAALHEMNWESIAHFIMTGEVKQPPNHILREERSFISKILGYFSPIVWVIIISIIYSIVRLILGLEITDYMKSALIAVFVFTLWMIVTVL